MEQVMFFDDERDLGNGIIVTLKRGWRWSDDMVPYHVKSFDTVAEAKSGIRDALPCSCSECIN